MCWIAYRDLFY